MDEGAVPSSINLVEKGEYELFDHQLPLDKFIDKLRNGDDLDNVCIKGLDEALQNGEIEDLRRVLQNKSNKLSQKGTTLQFVSEGSFQSVVSGFELKLGSDFFRLDTIFGPKMERKEEGWIVIQY